MKKIIIAITLLISLLSTQLTTAGPNENRNIKREEIQQQHSIREKIHSGELTKKEAALLQMQQIQIRHYKKLAKCDGKITRCERAYIKAEQARAGHNIYSQKHDRQKR
jgi:hypothetical protein